MIDSYVNHGLMSDGAGVRLKMHGLQVQHCSLCSTRVFNLILNNGLLQEAVVFSEIRASYEVYEKLDGLDKRVELLFIMAGKGPRMYAMPSLTGLY